MNDHCRLGVIGAGPAGLSLAKLAQESGRFAPTVLEREDVVGGKSRSLNYGDIVVELGTCYTTRAHRLVKRWMRELGHDLRPLGRQKFDAVEFFEYVKDGPGAPFVLQCLKYLYCRRALLRAIDSTTKMSAANRQIAMPVGDWLNAHNLPKMRKFMHRALTSLGYGYVDTTPTIQALRWCSLDLLLTGLFNQVELPVRGWSKFWCDLAETMEVKTGVTITSVKRSSAGAIIRTTEETLAFDAIAICIDPDIANRFLEPTEQEAFIAESLEYQGYFSAVIVADDWFDAWDSQGYSDACRSSKDKGRLVAVRRDGYSPDLGGQVYFTGQIPGRYTNAELSELLKQEVLRHGGTVSRELTHKRWKYFPQYKSQAILDGLLETMANVQGRNSTWYSGSAFSHEAVSNICDFNQALLKRMERFYRLDSRRTGPD
ncbi:FAD-dependent oxidoreductase [Denitrobaculum tricleocarpae]|uniref:FAD-dependent oxidoreductase n=1 Tax=Denitrobaculum tricleocarpae TaxID=2591009 RepID=UPI0015D2274D|nr:FAD-dependent oxidoreductase [Denitrobaculum tricleocarpae]